MKTIFKLIELVKKRISQELKQTKRGALLIDGWPCGSVHYVAAIWSCCAKILGATTIASRLSVLCVSPMGWSASAYVRDDGDDAETSRFDAEAHLEYFEEVFKLYDLSFQSWFKCMVCDNASVNKK